MQTQAHLFNVQVNTVLKMVALIYLQEQLHISRIGFFHMQFEA